ncbi:hypothetical protein GQ53DRAFT_693579 [Thozetella sp. PMI_491]|nr:hypothetical protein GQ53DRAFT_693579 [Thozetella sp. PMI_491]
MDSRGFGIRFFFAALGVIIAFSMGTFFHCIAVLSPYYLLSQSQLPARRSILLSPPSNPFSGLVSAYRQRHLYLGVVAFAAILADILPITLAHVPFSLVETAYTQLVCTYLSITILAVVFLVVATSFLVRWPHMPIDPRTIVGSLFYVHDSRIMASFDGLAVVDKDKRDRIMQHIGAKYVFGDMTGMSSKRRMGIDEWHGSGWR